MPISTFHHTIHPNVKDELYRELDDFRIFPSLKYVFDTKTNPYRDVIYKMLLPLGRLLSIIPYFRAKLVIGPEHYAPKWYWDD